ncbi:Crp/Fnr family transcriptional regulator [Micromonospora sp. STR1s_5]|nr:Crp/Fnr family transcriptional regulator [Micromonospora sp. STR1s_5]
MAALPAEILAEIEPYLEPVALKARRVLHYPNAPMEHVYFVEEGLVSVIADTGEGTEAEVWLIGPEGLVGVPALLGSRRSNHRRVVQAGGRALRISTAQLSRAMDALPPLRGLIMRYVMATLLQTSQSGACNAAHSVRQRLARWLLLADDRYDSRALPVTHRMLARLLGIRRASVTECLNVLAGDGLIDTARGKISIRDRPKLEVAACNCYAIIRREEERAVRDFEPHTAPQRR